MRGLLLAFLTSDLAGFAAGCDRARLRFIKTTAKATAKAV